MEFFKTVFRQKNFMFKLGIIVCLLWVIVAFIAPLIAPADPLAQNLDMRFQPPGAAHWFGTDSLGRDVFSRVLYGSRISITAGLITVLISFGIGLLYGGVAGYVGGIVDDVMMRFSEMIQSFPPLILAMVIAAAMGPSIVNSVFAMAIIWWPNYARLTRSIVISVKENDYVTASRLMGASRVRILFREILPNSIGPLVVMSTLDLGNAILMFSGLSFLGLGVQPPTPEWGAMLNYAQQYMRTAPYMAIFPGLAIALTALSINLVGDGLRDALDPKSTK